MEAHWKVERLHGTRKKMAAMADIHSCYVVNENSQLKPLRLTNTSSTLGFLHIISELQPKAMSRLSPGKNLSVGVHILPLGASFYFTKSLPGCCHSVHHSLQLPNNSFLRPLLYELRSISYLAGQSGVKKPEDQCGLSAYIRRETTCLRSNPQNVPIVLLSEKIVFSLAIHTQTKTELGIQNIPEGIQWRACGAQHRNRKSKLP